MQHKPYLTVEPSSTPINAQWLDQLNSAIRENDERAMWQIIQQSDDPIHAHETLTTLLTRMAYKAGSKVRFAELFMVPVISDDNTFLATESWTQASFAISEAVDIWKPRGCSKVVFNGVRAYDWVGTWRPEVIRKHLVKSVPGNEDAKLKLVTQEIDLPQHAPRLGFVIFVLTSDLGWPKIGTVTPIQDDRMQRVVSYAFQTQPDHAPIVLAPERAQFAITQGLSKWLQRLHEQIQIKGWVAQPVASTPDVVKISLALNDENVRWSQFTIRKHQIGIKGLNELIGQLERLAPNLEVPMDLKNIAPKSSLVDLT